MSDNPSSGNGGTEISEESSDISQYHGHLGSLPTTVNTPTMAQQEHSIQHQSNHPATSDTASAMNEEASGHSMQIEVNLSPKGDDAAPSDTIMLQTSSNTFQDYLTSLPTEILLKIVAEVPMHNFLDILHTSKFLRQFMKVNAAPICNEVIRSRWFLESKLLRSELVDGWLVPKHPKIKNEEREYLECHHRVHKGQRYLDRYAAVTRNFSLLGDTLADSENIITITKPGPQFLYFLEVGIFRAEQSDLKGASIYRSEEWEEEGGEKTYFCWFEEYVADWIWWFLELVNDQLFGVRNGTLYPTTSKFGRELVWYYGVEGLRIVR